MNIDTGRKQDTQLFMAMTAHEAGNPKRIQHFTKVYTFAEMIGEMEGLGKEELHILRTAALVHDIGIKKAMSVYGSSNGKYQEALGPEIAEHMLRELGYEMAVIERVKYLVGHHHTYEEMDGADYQILVEADFLVNLYEDASDETTIANVYQNIFRTRGGRKICQEMFGVS